MDKIIDGISNFVNKEIKDGGCLMLDTHFEIGKLIHTNQFYFLKPVFENSEYLNDLETLVFNEIKDQRDIILVGFHSYVGLLLSKIKVKLPDLEIGIIEELYNEFYWQIKPINSAKKIVLLLPISCTFLAYNKLNLFLNDYCVSNFHLVLFCILHKDLKNREQVNFQQFNSDNLNEFYSKYNWIRIYKDKIDVAIYNNKDSLITFKFFIPLYSDLSSPISCKYCFGKEEKILYSTYNYEVPKLILGVPPKLPEKCTTKTYLSLKNYKDIYKTYVYQNVQLNTTVFTSFIHAQNYYLKNQDDILIKFFDKIKITSINTIIISVESNINSTFISDFVNLHPDCQNYLVFRFRNYENNIDQILSLNKIIKNKSTLIYFEDVLSNGRTLQHIVDALFIKDVQFDYILTLVDRTSPSRKKELLTYLKKDGSFMSFTKILMPNTNNQLDKNPLEDERRILERAKKLSFFDSTKNSFNIKLKSISPTIITDNELFNSKTEISIQLSNIENLIFNCKNHFNKDFYIKFTNIPYIDSDGIDLLKQYCFQELYVTVSALKPSIDFTIKSLVSKITNSKNFKQISNEIIKNNNNNVHTKIENIISDLVIKNVCKNPFIKYKIIEDNIFNFIKLQLKEFISSYNKVQINETFNHFIKFKFYIKRSVELNMNEVLSEEFFLAIKNIYSNNRLNKMQLNYSLKRKVLHDCIKEFNKVKDLFSEEEALMINKIISKGLSTVEYKLNQIEAFPLFLNRCFKELINRNPYKSIILEKVLNSKNCLPDFINIKDETDVAKLKELFQDNYFHLTGMLKAENLYCFQNLLEINEKKSENIKVYDLPNSLYSCKDFLSASRHLGTIKHESIIKSLENSVSANQFLLNRINVTNRNVSTKFIDELSEILDKINSIFNFEFKVYTDLFIEYKRYDLSKPIFHINKGRYTDVNVSTLGLNKDGLLYNFLTEIHGNMSFPNPQSFLAIFKVDDAYYGFNDTYFVRDNSKNFSGDNELFGWDRLHKKVSLNDLIEIDRSNENLANIFKSANMFMLFRISDEVKHGEDFVQKGESILILSIKEEITYENLQEFFSNEKMRLFLLIKNNLLKYIKKQFESDAFIDVIGKLKMEKFQSSLRHGLKNYLELIENIVIKKNLTDDDIKIFEIIFTSVKIQLGEDFIKLNRYFYKKECDFDKIQEYILLVLKSPKICGHPIQGIDIELDIEKDTIIENGLLNVVILEILMNIKYHCPRAKPSIKILIRNNSLLFFNNVKKSMFNSEVVSNYSDQKGIKLCEKLCNLLKYNFEFKVVNNIFQTKIDRHG
ncbi:MAG: hypothetical protein KA270_01865 [Saprospiraceae bacterium]|nr:hypothetical protein [Saprospiraceae bacterium]MBP6565880.1 hypothetical protein [Saprospiraceae bacterium]